MGNGFDDCARRFGRATTRRQVLGLFGRTALVGSVGVGVMEMFGARSAHAACLTEYPPANLTDCPNKRPHPGNVRTSNGCGPEGSAFPLPQGFGSASFTTACNGHDICYETCNSPKAGCDSTFGDQMVDTCVATYNGSFLRETACIALARLYEAGVSAGGGSAYDAAQKKDCECCRPVPMVYCGCNHKCYTSASLCTTECHGTLGCFSQICGPATAQQCP